MNIEQLRIAVEFAIRKQDTINQNENPDQKELKKWEGIHDKLLSKIEKLILEEVKS